MQLHILVGEQQISCRKYGSDLGQLLIKVALQLKNNFKKRLNYNIQEQIINIKFS